MNNGLTGIVIKLIADTQQFLKDTKTAISSAVNIAKLGGGQISAALTKAFNPAAAAQLTAQLQKMGAVLQSGTALWKQLSNSAGNYNNIIKGFSVTNARIAAVYTNLTNEATKFGVSIQKMAQIQIATGQITVAEAQKTLQARGKQVLSTYQLADALRTLQQNIDRVARGEKMLLDVTNQATKAQREQGKQAGRNSDIFSFLGNRIKAVVASLAVASAAYNFVRFLKDMASESTSVSQSMFNFRASVTASQSVLGESAGTLAEWEDRIKSLRVELAIFSERDIRDAITQTISLTRNLNLGRQATEDILKVATVLAKTTGVDLNQAISDVTHAMTGSRVVLDKYGLNIRDGDLKVRALALGMDKATESMTSQEIAIVTLAEVLSQANALIEATGGYQETLAGQVKATEAQIKDSSDVISESLGQLNLLFKNLYADFLSYIAGVADRFAPLKAFLDSFEVSNSRFTLSRGLEDMGIKAPNAADYFEGFDKAKVISGSRNPNDYSTIGGNRLLNPAALVGKVDVQNLRDYTDAFMEYRRLVREYMTEQNFNLNQQTLESREGGPGEYRPPAFDSDKLFQLTPEEMEAEAKFNEEIDDLLLERQRKIDDAWSKYVKETGESFREEASKLKEIERDFLRDIADLNRESVQAIEDATRDYQRDLAEIDIDETQKIQDLEKEKNEQLIKIKDDYYDALRQLDAQYFFDLFDAVAANDAVAIKQAERKYNLDKAKLKDKFDEDNKNAEDGYLEGLEELKQDSQRRRDELQRRYNQELEDLRIEQARKQEELRINRDREKADTKQHYLDLRQELKNRYQDERDQIDLETSRRYNDLVADLQKEFDAHKAHFKKIKAENDLLFADLLEKEEEYLQDRQDLLDAFNPQTGSPPPAGIVCQPGYEWSWNLYRCIPKRKTVGVVDTGGGGGDTGFVGGGGGGTSTIILTSDGTVGDSVLEAVAAEIADALEVTVARRG